MDLILVVVVVTAAVTFSIRGFVRIYKGEGACSCGGGCSCSSKNSCNFRFPYCK